MNTKLVTRKGAPVALAILGVSAIIMGVASAVKPASEAKEVTDNLKKEVERIHKIDSEMKESESYDEPEIATGKALATAYMKAGVRYVKLFGPSASLIGGGIVCLLGSNHIYAKRYAAISSAYTGLSEAYNMYRKRVADAIGEDKEHDIFYNAKDVEETIEVKKGKAKKRTYKTFDIDDIVESTPFAYRLNADTCTYFNEFNPQETLDHVKTIFCMANDKLQAQGKDGVIFVNDIVPALGLELDRKTENGRNGQIMGWPATDPRTGEPVTITYETIETKPHDNTRYLNTTPGEIIIVMHVYGNVLHGVKRSERNR